MPRSKGPDGPTTRLKENTSSFWASDLGRMYLAQKKTGGPVPSGGAKKRAVKKPTKKPAAKKPATRKVAKKTTNRK